MNIYCAIEDMIKVEKYRSLYTKFDSEVRENLDTDTDKEIFDILKNISTLSLKVCENTAEFIPMFVFENERTFAIQDIRESDYILLSNLDLTKLPLNLKARLADIFWLQKTDYKYAVIAHESYYELFKLLFDPENYIESLDMIQRAICISSQINDKNSLNKYCQVVFDYIINIDGKDENFLTVSLVDIIIKQSFGDLSKIVCVLDNSLSLSKDNPHKIEQLCSLKVNCFNKLKKPELAKQTNIELAEYFLQYGENILEKDGNRVAQTEHLFLKSIFLFRNNGEPSKAENAHKRLVEIQKRIPNTMAVRSISFDAGKIIENIRDNMTGLSFQECILRLSQMVSFYKKEDFKQIVLESIKTSIFSQLCAVNIINDAGQTVFVLPPLDITNPEKNEELLDMHIQHKMLEHESITGTMFLRFAILYIRENFDVENESFDFVVNDNIVIPDDRKNIISKALREAFCLNCYEALHILAPQIENVFRYIAQESGGLTVTLEQDGSSKEKVLSSIFDLEELKECYNNDILFLFKGLLNEQVGANIRNNIAHGIMSPQRSLSGECIFFICAVIKLLAISSRYCLSILDSEKLRTYKKIDKNIRIGT